MRPRRTGTRTAAAPHDISLKVLCGMCRNAVGPQSKRNKVVPAAIPRDWKIAARRYLLPRCGRPQNARVALAARDHQGDGEQSVLAVGPARELHLVVAALVDKHVPAVDREAHVADAGACEEPADPRAGRGPEGDAPRTKPSPPPNRTGPGFPVALAETSVP